MRLKSIQVSEKAAWIKIMQKTLTSIFFMVSLLGLSVTVAAETVSYRFGYVVTYEKKSFGSSPKDGELDRALGMARQEIWNKHLKSVSEDKLIRYEAPDVREKIESRFDEIVSLEGEARVQIDEKKEVFKISGRGEVNVTLLSTIASSGTRSDKSFSDLVIGFMVLPRLQKVVTTFDVEREATETATSRTMQESAMRVEVAGEASNSSGNAIVGEKNTAEISVSNSGSTTSIAQDADYVIGDVRQVTNNLNSFFTRAGFQATNYAEIAAYCGGPNPDLVMEAIVDRNSGDLPMNLKKGVFDATTDKNCLNGEFFIMGTIDIDSIAMVQGLWEANAAVNVEVFDLTKRIPRSFATVQSVRASGSGRTQDVAKFKAVENATEIIGSEIRTAFTNLVQ